MLELRLEVWSYWNMRGSACQNSGVSADVGQSTSAASGSSEEPSACKKTMPDRGTKFPRLASSPWCSRHHAMHIHPENMPRSWAGSIHCSPGRVSKNFPLTSAVAIAAGRLWLVQLRRCPSENDGPKGSSSKRSNCRLRFQLCPRICPIICVVLCLRGTTVKCRQLDLFGCIQGIDCTTFPLQHARVDACCRRGKILDELSNIL